MSKIPMLKITLYSLHCSASLILIMYSQQKANKYRQSNVLVSSLQTRLNQCSVCKSGSVCTLLQLLCPPLHSSIFKQYCSSIQGWFSLRSTLWQHKWSIWLNWQVIMCTQTGSYRYIFRHTDRLIFNPFVTHWQEPWSSFFNRTGQIAKTCMCILIWKLYHTCTDISIFIQFEAQTQISYTYVKALP